MINYNYSQFYVRALTYFLIFFSYLLFMSNFSPLGIHWLSWHTQKILNLSEFLKINGYFSHYGFSISSFCENCSLVKDQWSDNIYYTKTYFSYLPYVVFYHFFGETNLKTYAHLIDKFAIFSTGLIISETLILLSKKNLIKFTFLKAILFFTFFTVNPWTYKMILAYWIQIFFVFFFLLGILMFLTNKINYGLLFFFLAGLIDYQSSAGIFTFYFIIIAYYFYHKNIPINQYIPLYNKQKSFDFRVLTSLIVPVLIYFLLLTIAQDNLNAENKNVLLTRIGISGYDPHNGGIIGALQFLGGNRISVCFLNFDFSNQLKFDDKIFIFNCVLSLLSIFLISLVSLIGLVYIYRDNEFLFKIMILPLLFLLLCYTFLLQQSSSAHLMGYSYFFSILFSLGLAYLISKVLDFYKFSIISITLSLPVVTGLILICIRVSMMTGPNG